MKTIVCTLFENDYVIGLGVLANSLWASGYRGRLIAGYRGVLPDWVKADSAGLMQWGDGMEVEFKFLRTEAHFTNFKAEFMLSLFDDSSVDAVFYVDPDIVVNEPWVYFEQWVQAGVAVCEDVNSPIPIYNPRRYGWRKTLEVAGVMLTPRFPEYANGGFVGISREYLVFLKKWQEIQALVAAALGGADRVGIGGGVKLSKADDGFAHCWSTTDQDALNAAMEACPDIPVSFSKRSMMGFAYGFCGLPHALGPNKPWCTNYFRRMLLGHAPSRVHRVFWEKTDFPIRVLPRGRARFIKILFLMILFITRFYRR